MPFTVSYRFHSPCPSRRRDAESIAAARPPPRSPVRHPAHRRSILSLQQRNIELGRVALVNLAADPLYGKLVTIVDFVDMNRVSSEAGARPRALATCDARLSGRE